MSVARDYPPVSLIIPCRNESAHLDAVLEALLAQDYPGSLECLVAEGRSTDDTRRRLETWVARDARVRVVDNPDGIVPTGLNRAIRLARGDIIVRADAHSHYAPDYVRRCVEVLQATGAANVGGPAGVGGDRPLQQAFALATGSRLALGGARSKRTDYEGPVDTVQYGCWWRRTLLEVGLFDEDFVRNQDDELNLRIQRQGGLIWQSAAIRSRLLARPTLRGLFRQYWQYGYWKVWVIAKHGRPASLRHLIPACFLGLLLLLFLAAPFLPITAIALGASLAVYAAAILVEVLRLCLPRSPRLVPWVLLVFPTVHLAYGSGFLAALLDRLLGSARPRSTASQSSR